MPECPSSPSNLLFKVKLLRGSERTFLNAILRIGHRKMRNGEGQRDLVTVGSNCNQALNNCSQMHFTFHLKGVLVGHSSSELPPLQLLGGKPTIWSTYLIRIRDKICCLRRNHWNLWCGQIQLYRRRIEYMFG